MEIWRGGEQGRVERLENATRLAAGEAAAGLTLELEVIWTV